MTLKRLCQRTSRSLIGPILNVRLSKVREMGNQPTLLARGVTSPAARQYSVDVLPAVSGNTSQARIRVRKTAASSVVFATGGGPTMRLPKLTTASPGLTPAQISPTHAQVR